jgi:CRP-like cAMP-binding protein
MNSEIKSRKGLEKILEKYSSVKLKRNEHIFQPGDTLDFAYFVKSGFVRVYAICKNGQEVTVFILKPHSLLPLFFAPNRLKSRFYAETLTGVEAYQIPRKEMVNLATENPEIVSEVMDSLTVTFRDALGRIEYLASGNAYTKVVSVLLSLAAESSRKTNEATLDLPATHRIIASLTGLTRETVTLQMLRLKKRGLIAGKGRHLVIKDLAHLREEGACLGEES